MDAKTKEPVISYKGVSYRRIPIKTHLIVENENMKDVLDKYVKNELKEGDIVFISEKACAITQGRAYPIKSIKPRFLAKVLSHFVTKTPAGIGLGMPETMEMALRECGTLRILFASYVSFITKLVGKKGYFYKIAGYRASSIDGPTPNTIPPYNTYVVLGPDKPDKLAKELGEHIKSNVIIVDLNDLGGSILGCSDAKMDKKELYHLLKDNPLGQSREQTPMGIIRRIKKRGHI